MTVIEIEEGDTDHSSLRAGAEPPCDAGFGAGQAVSAAKTPWPAEGDWRAKGLAEHPY
jgi:hypothetical protein